MSIHLSFLTALQTNGTGEPSLRNNLFAQAAQGEVAVTAPLTSSTGEGGSSESDLSSLPVELRTPAPVSFDTDSSVFLPTATADETDLENVEPTNNKVATAVPPASTNGVNTPSLARLAAPDLPPLPPMEEFMPEFNGNREEFTNQMVSIAMGRRDLAKSRFGSRLTDTQAEATIRQVFEQSFELIEFLNTERGMNINASDWFMFMALETGGTFDPSIANPNSQASSLIQFMRNTVTDINRVYGTNYSQSSIRDMPVEELLAPDGPVAQYFMMWQDRKGADFDSVAKLYLAVAAPAHLDKPDNYVLYTGSTAAANPAWDVNDNGAIEKFEIGQAAEIYWQQLSDAVGFDPTLISMAE